MARRKFSIMTAFADVLFNIIFNLIILLFISLMLVNPPEEKNKKNGDVILKAEYLVTVEWDSGSKDDIDLWVQSPTGEVVFYGRPNVNTLSLDRDDRGEFNDVVTLADGRKEVIKDNWEHVMVRKVIPGEYVVNLMMFSKKDTFPATTKVKVERLNPYQLVYQGTVVMRQQQQEETVIRFTLDSKGNSKNLNKDPEPLVQKMQRMR